MATVKSSNINITDLDFEEVETSLKEYLKGQSSSLQLGISALPEDCDAAIIILGDMPDINTTLINQLIENYDPSANKSIIIPTYKNKKGNPVLIDREFFPDILSIKGDKGAKDIIKANKKFINEIFNNMIF